MGNIWNSIPWKYTLNGGPQNAHPIGGFHCYVSSHHPKAPESAVPLQPALRFQSSCFIIPIPGETAEALRRNMPLGNIEVYTSGKGKTFFPTIIFGFYVNLQGCSLWICFCNDVFTNTPGTN